MNKTIGIIGYGNMGSAIAERISSKYELFVFDKDASRLQGIQGMSVVRDIPELVKSGEIILIAVKPQDFDLVLEESKPFAKGKMFISIAAGIETSYIENKLGEVRVVRAMPNIGAITGQSATCICKGKFATQDDVKLAKALFSHITKIEVQEVTEDKMNAVTAVSGSGPGYYFNEIVRRHNEYSKDKGKFCEEFKETLANAAKEIGLDERLSLLLANETVNACELTLTITKLSAEKLRDQVTSKGGTTEAALQVLRNGGTLTEAVKAAVQRAKELSRR